VDGGGRAGPARSETSPSVSSGPYSTTAGKRSTTLHCSDNSCCQQCHCSRALRGRPCVWSAEARVLRQRGTLRIQGTVPGSSKTFVCYTDYIEKVAPLLRRVQDHCDYGFSVGRYSSQSRCHGAYIKVGSGTGGFVNRLQAMHCNQVSSSSRFYGRVAREPSPNSSRQARALDHVLRWVS
jgi:hypothetical protein